MKVPMAALFLVVTLTPCLGLAQSSDADYCAALAAKYDAYIDTAGDKGGRATPTDIVVAESKCKSDPAMAIPVLEKALKAARLSLPAHG